MRGHTWHRHNSVRPRSRESSQKGVSATRSHPYKLLDELKRFNGTVLKTVALRMTGRGSARPLARRRRTPRRCTP